MKEIASRLWIGSQIDWEQIEEVDDTWAVVHACKEPYHRKALGYTGRAAPKDHPEYLIAKRGNRLILNLIDVDDPKYVAKAIVDAAMAHIDEHLAAGALVMCHCNQGASRSPTLGMLFMAHQLPEAFDEAETMFKAERYPDYSPAKGMQSFARENWGFYRNRAPQQGQPVIP